MEMPWPSAGACIMSMGSIRERYLQLKVMGITILCQFRHFFIFFVLSLPHFWHVTYKLIAKPFSEFFTLFFFFPSF